MDVFDFYYEMAEPPDQERIDKDLEVRLGHYRNRKNDG